MRWTAPFLAFALVGCAAQSALAPAQWYSTQDGVLPNGDNRAFVCHGFGCHYKSVYAFSPGDIATMRRIIGRPSSPAAERALIQKMISWAEKRVAKTAGSAGDVGGLDMENARKRGQMDCIDEATNTTSYLLIAQENRLLRFHEVASPVARGFFLDGRYPHATAVIRNGEKTYAVDSWPQANGVPPDVMPLEEWFEKSTASS
ncbi:MAG: hypothetical protein AAGB11_17275 [Pseudomonadota bacterium]